MKLAPIILFVYNRLYHTQQTIHALSKNPLALDSELIVYSDGPKESSVETVQQVREFLKKIEGFKKMIFTIFNFTLFMLFLPYWPSLALCDFKLI